MIASAKNKTKMGMGGCRVTGGRKGYYFLDTMIGVKPLLCDFWLEWNEGVSYVDIQGKSIPCK